MEARTAGLSGAASHSYAFVSAWEEKAPLNAVQLAAVASLANCGELPEPAHLAEEDPPKGSQHVAETPRASGEAGGSPRHSTGARRMGHASAADQC